MPRPIQQLLNKLKEWIENPFPHGNQSTNITQCSILIDDLLAELRDNEYAYHYLIEINKIFKKLYRFPKHQRDSINIDYFRESLNQRMIQLISAIDKLD